MVSFAKVSPVLKIHHCDKHIEGSITVSGAKNAVLPIIAAATLFKNATIKRVPLIIDVENMLNIMEVLGFKINLLKKDNYKNEVSIERENSLNNHVPHYLCEKIRASILFLGALLSMRQEVFIYYPGGCKLGFRPINYHIRSLKEMGAKFSFRGDLIIAKARELKGCDIRLPFPSVGATENIILAAVSAKGQTRIFNAAIEPEIIDMINFLKRGGVKIKVFPVERIIEVNGDNSLPIDKNITHEVIPDRIETLTYLALVAILGGEIALRGVSFSFIQKPIEVLRALGVEITSSNDTLRAKNFNEKPRINDIYIETYPYPGFPTDAHPIFLVIFLFSKCRATIVEKVYENRFRYIEELKKMGAKVKVDFRKREVTIQGPQILKGTNVVATDLRGGAALILAGTKALGATILENAWQVHRGYEDLINKFARLGITIEQKER